jgi:ribosomal protein S18 acetylase RimI-like enzyme
MIQTAAGDTNVGARPARLDTSVVLAACREGRIVGVTGLAPQPGPQERRRGFLWGMYVRPEARRLGAASLLMDAILAAATARFEQIELDVAAGNFAALSLYEKFGFVRYETAPQIGQSGRDSDGQASPNRPHVAALAGARPARSASDLPMGNTFCRRRGHSIAS